MKPLSEEELARLWAEALPEPERGLDYGQRVWERIESRLEQAPRPRLRRFWDLPWQWQAMPAAALVALLVMAFLAGRFFPWTRPATADLDAQAKERVLRAAVGDYLERSQLVLVELANATAEGGLDIRSEQERAADLVVESRLYAQTAARTGDTAVAGILEELERVLLEISHAPAQISEPELDALRRRLEAEGILFKIRVLGRSVREL